MTATDERQTTAAFESDLVDRIMDYVRMADVGEEARRRSDSVGMRMMYGFHWNVDMPEDRAAITANIGMALILHKIAIQTKQDPIPVVEPDEAGDANAATNMRAVLMHLWRTDAMKGKIRRAQTLCNASRTCAGHVLWDPTLARGNGDITTEIIPGWNMIIDNRVSDPQLMQFCGHRATMNRARAMRLYPESAHRILDAPTANADKRPALMRSSPHGSPFVLNRLGAGTVTTVNSQPVVTSFAGDMGMMPITQDRVEIKEVFHRDPSAFEEDVRKTDSAGEPIQEIVRDEEGRPQFHEQDEQGMEYIPSLGSHVPVPVFKIAMRDVYETKLVPIYPYWRRTTILQPGDVLLEDIAWDGPLPYIFFNDQIALDGFITRGTLLQCHHLQGLLNVSLSTMCDNLRMGSIKAWLAGAQSGFVGQTLIPAVGQVIPVNDPSQITPLESPQLDANWFTLLDHVVALMERIVGTEGVMQGEATGRVDSGQGYDLLAEIGGSRMVESTQRLESTLADWARICGWFVQTYYTRDHAISVEDSMGNLTWETAYGPFLQGAFLYSIATGSTMAWSESASRARLMDDMHNGLIDKIGVWQRLQYPDWKRIAARLQTQNPVLSGPAAAPPPRTRSSVQTKPKAPGMTARR